jgi:prepilin-type N-terminal cleavage/methylation domain
MKHKKGFTLVEMLLVMGITGILIVVLSQVFGSILTMKLRSEATSAVAQDARYLLSRLSYDVARSSSIATPSPSELELTIGGVVHEYTLDNGRLMLAVGGGTPQALTGVRTQLTSLTFTKLADLGTKQNVEVNATLASTISQPGGPPQIVS